MLSINMPETSDTDFSWQEFVRRNNDELVATYGNLVHRVLTIAYRNFDGHVPDADADDVESISLLSKAEATLQAVDSLLYGCHFREAMREAMSLAQEANRYLDTKAPWKAIKEDRGSAAAALSTALGVICCLKTVLYPFLPYSSGKLHRMLGFDGSVEESGWNISVLQAGQKLLPPEPLFTKLDDVVIEEENNRLEQRVLTPG
jgi:methionyl-tRNA synthetase